jgi:2,3-diketo-5-methylthio-1-phosphopentane phosphatase
MVDDISEPGERLYTVHIFCDFDGTISGRDIGFDLFHRHGVQEPWHSRMLAREISVAEYWRGVFTTLDPALTPEALDEYLAAIPIDPGFADLLALARREGIRFTVVSDGFDLYIERFLRLHGVEGLEVHANHAELAPGGVRVSFPNAAEGCDCFCAGCKRNLLLGLSDPESRIVYIGDGISDYCPAEHADIIFAKRDLAAYCNAHRLPHYPFKTLGDVARQMALLLERRRIRPRHQAMLKRKGVWEAE